MYDELAAYFKTKKVAKVKLFRTKVREGLIRGRLQAARKAVGEVYQTVSVLYFVTWQIASMLLNLENFLIV